MHNKEHTSTKSTKKKFHKVYACANTRARKRSPRYVRSCSSWSSRLQAMAPSKERRFSLSDPDVSIYKRLLYRIWYVYLPLLWETAVACSTIVSTFITSYQAVYHAGLLWQWVLVYAMDLIYITYVVFRFFKPYKRRGEVVTCKKKIALNYIRTSFFPDLLSMIPLEVFSVVSANPIYVAAFLRLNRCIRCYKVWTLLCECLLTMPLWTSLCTMLEFVAVASKEKELGTNTMLLMSLRFTFLAALSIHIAGGLWFFLSCHNVVDMHSVSSSLLHADHHEVCRDSTWANNEGWF